MAQELLRELLCAGAFATFQLASTHLLKERQEVRQGPVHREPLFRSYAASLPSRLAGLQAQAALHAPYKLTCLRLAAIVPIRRPFST